MIFDSFPVNPEFYSEDMRHMVADTICRHGVKEWRAGVLTNELHGHLGVYALLGVKMGIYALEILNVEAGDIAITSFAGTKPPVSCFNDGLQVSTEATFGHGLITSGPTGTPLPEAVFRTAKRSIHVRLKQYVFKEITEEIKQAAERWGNTSAYWDYVRQLAIRYWSEFDRKEIFEFIEL